MQIPPEFLEDTGLYLYIFLKVVNYFDVTSGAIDVKYISSSEMHNFVYVYGLPRRIHLVLIVLFD